MIVMIKEKLQVLTKYRRKENSGHLDMMAQKLHSIRTWKDLRMFVTGLDDVLLAEYMLSPIVFFENKNEKFLSLEEQERRTFENDFHLTFTNKTGSFAWPISDETKLTKRHLNAILAFCVSPAYGYDYERRGNYILRSINDCKGEEPPHIVGIIKYHIIFSLLPEFSQEAVPTLEKINAAA